MHTVHESSPCPYSVFLFLLCISASDYLIYSICIVFMGRIVVVRATTFPFS